MANAAKRLSRPWKTSAPSERDALPSKDSAIVKLPKVAAMVRRESKYRLNHPLRNRGRFDEREKGLPFRERMSSRVDSLEVIRSLSDYRHTWLEAAVRPGFILKSTSIREKLAKA
jgi:hypothetical protein